MTSMMDAGGGLWLLNPRSAEYSVVDSLFLLRPPASGDLAGPEPLSTASPMRQVHENTVNLNIIMCRAEHWGSQETRRLMVASQTLSRIIAQAPVGVGRVQYFDLTEAQVAAASALGMDRDAAARLGRMYMVDNDDVDIFVYPTWTASSANGAFNGIASPFSLCNKEADRWADLVVPDVRTELLAAVSSAEPHDYGWPRMPVIRLSDGSGLLRSGEMVGRTLAHELGHFIGHLFYRDGPPDNLMVTGGSGDHLDDGQREDLCDGLFPGGTGPMTDRDVSVPYGVVGCEAKVGGQYHDADQLR